MADSLLTELEGMVAGAAYVVGGLLVLVLARYVLDFLTPYRLDQELTERDNPALGLPVSAYFVSVMIIYLGAALGPDVDPAAGVVALLTQVGVDMGYALAGVLGLNLARVVLDRAVFTKFSTVKEILEDRNVGTGAVEMGSYVGSALVIAGAVHGQKGGPLTALVFFVLGQITLILFARFYQLMIRYDLHAEIERDNVAAGVAMGLNLIAVSIIVCKGTVAEFESWGTNLAWFAVDVLLGFGLLYVLRKITDAVFLPGVSLDDEISRDRNLNAAWLEGAVANSIAVLIFFLI